VVPTGSEGDSETQLHEDLGVVIAAWDRLPVAIKAGILALVEAAAGGDLS
jgi:hypothetical protein